MIYEIVRSMIYILYHISYNISYNGICIYLSMYVYNRDITITICIEVIKHSLNIVIHRYIDV